MKLFLKKIEQGQIPIKVPNRFQHQQKNVNAVKKCIQVYYRDMLASKYGMWLLVDLTWTKQLASWLQNQRVLEIMAGRGWLAKALDHHGVNITPTDDLSWEPMINSEVFPVQQSDAIEAVKSLGSDHDILLVSWCPHNDETINRACEAWGRDRPIIYIGEGEGGANAPDSFFKCFRPIFDAPVITIPKWWFVHDQLMIGQYKNL